MAFPQDDFEADEALELLFSEGRNGERADLRRVFHQIAKNMSEAIVVTEAELEKPGPRILWVNDAFVDITGYGREDVLGQTPRLLQGPKTDEHVLQRLRRQLEAGQKFEGETVNYRKDGTTYVNYWSIAPVRGDDDEIVCWVSVQRDVTEKRRLQEEMLRTLDEERRRIGRDLHDSVGSLVTAASIRLETLMDEMSLDPSHEDEFENIRATIKDTYERLRRISKGLSPVDLVEGGLSEGLQRLASITPNCSFERTIDLDDRLAFLDTTDRTNLYWLIYEAVTNAERHADPDHIRLQVDEVEEEAAAVRFVVEDDGIGFDRADEEEEAWGLRLMEYRADLIGASLTVESQPGVGTRVACRLFE